MDNACYENAWNNLYVYFHVLHGYNIHRTITTTKSPGPCFKQDRLKCHVEDPFSLINNRVSILTIKKHVFRLQEINKNIKQEQQQQISIVVGFHQFFAKKNC